MCPADLSTADCISPGKVLDGGHLEFGTDPGAFASPASYDTEWELVSERCCRASRSSSETRSEPASSTENGDWLRFPSLMEILCGSADACHRFGSGDIVRISTHGVSALWAVVGVYFDSIEAVQNLNLSGMTVPTGTACKAWAFVDDAQPERWLVLFLIGVFDGVQLTAREWTTEEFFQGLVNLSGPLMLQVGFAQFIPWSEYRKWRRQCDLLLDASFQVWAAGEDIDVVETRIYQEMEGLLR
ncbi:hypothetical protein HIM_12074 [Hirsutella minnesotensis 3608]|uniref:Uncharacterized protein n=1 Tax=Hirsutella minnesotensis 3608 TaxID=1043627 RepID=A0A0F7ZIE8_9HYPO|nr:hypothetical protein HIM_12074 [Hirsutella minnesotensis 3608]